MSADAATAVVPVIVCVDDDLPLLHSLREQLLRGLNESCEVELASDGEEALALLAELDASGARVPLLISDHLMPGMRGADLLAMAHRRYPRLLTILLTGQADVDAVGQAVNRANLYRLLTKPWHEGDLLLTVREALRRFDQERQLAEQAAALQASNHRLAQSVHLLQATMDATIDGLLVLGDDGLPLQVNRQLKDMMSLPQDLELPRDAQQLLSLLRAQMKTPQATVWAPMDDAAMDTPTVVELLDGRCLEYAGRAYLLHGQRMGTVLSFRDVTDRELNARLLRHQALHDNLSGLPNRLQFGQALDRAVDEARASSGSLAVLFVDLDHFKRINDSLGHDFGDELLKRTADRLTRCIRHGDLIARWGGDEFTVLAPNLRVGAEAEHLARRIVESLEEPFLVGDMSLRVSASVGLASFPSDGDDGQALLKRADMALYRAKEEGRNGFQCFRHSAFDEEILSPQSIALETDLREAIAGNALLLHYQPQIDTSTGRIAGVEALARWHHPQHGWIGPNVFIPIAERSGLILALGEWVLNAACLQAADWQRQGLDTGCIAVNLSAVQFDRSDVEAMVRHALRRSGLSPDALELEVTEAVALRDVGGAASTLQALRRAGIRIALDDFGTGFASLSYLKQLPCDTLKIDRSFIRSMDRDSKDTAIIRAVVALAEGLELRVVAEGVETAEIAKALAPLGCQTMQGYLFSEPVDAQALTSLLRQPTLLTELGFDQ